MRNESNYDFLFEKPVVIVSGRWVQRYYTSLFATLQDGFDPYKVARVCLGGQKTHKGKRFRFANEYENIAYQITKEIAEGGENHEI